MPYFKDSANQLHFLSAQDIEAGGKQYLPEGVEEISVEEAETLKIQTPVELTIIQQIEEIELSITPRRLREAVLSTTGKNWLKEANSRIDSLRATIV